MAKQSSSNKALHGPPEDKSQRQLEHDFDPTGGAPAGNKIVTCYNAGCPDYRRPRSDGSKCGCAKNAVGSLT